MTAAAGSGPSLLREWWLLAEVQAWQVLDRLGKNNLWQRILKSSICTTLLVIITVIPGVGEKIGPAAYLGALETVFGHPGRRFGQMAEALVLAVTGVSLAVGWAALGVYLASLVIETNPAAGWTIRAIFLTVAAWVHGFLRSKSPRLFLGLILFAVVSVVESTNVSKKVTPKTFTNVFYPILLGAGIIPVVNILIFPEFSTGYLGRVVIDTLTESSMTLKEAGDYFITANQPTKDSDTANGTHVNGAKQSKAATAAGEADEAQGFRKRLLHFAKMIAYPSRSHCSSTITKRHCLSDPAQGTKIQDLIGAKEAIRQNLADCKAAQQECQFELAISVLPPRDMKGVSGKAMKRFTANIISVVGACESKFALMGERDLSVDDRDMAATTKPSEEDQQTRKSSTTAHLSARQRQESVQLDLERAELEAIKPKRGIAHGDVELLEHLIEAIAEPYRAFSGCLDVAMDALIKSIGFAFNLSVMPSGEKAPKHLTRETLERDITALQTALARFDDECTAAIEGSRSLTGLGDRELDIMPREEVFLMSSFVLNLRQAGAHVESMLRHAQLLVEKNRARRGRRRVYFPNINWRKWFLTGGIAEDEALPNSGRKQNRTGDIKALLTVDRGGSYERLPTPPKVKVGDLEGVAELKKPSDDNGEESKGPETPRDQTHGSYARPKLSRTLKLRGVIADIVEWLKNSDDVLNGIKIAIGVNLLTWPAWVNSWNAWFGKERALWASIQLVFVSEASIGSSITTFTLRFCGTTLGALWGWAAYEAHEGNRIVACAMVFVACFPFYYVAIGTSYNKAGNVANVSQCVVLLASILQTGTYSDSGTQVYLKRYLAFLIGGVTAVILELTLFPVKARTRFVESLDSAIRHINEMQKCISVEIDEPRKVQLFAGGKEDQLNRASTRANAALGAADTLLPFCKTEPRLKGSFEPMALIYGEMLFVLHQIVDRMDNVSQLRMAFGSGPLEEYNVQLFAYRRNVAGAISLTLYAVQTALLTKTPLPQFMPSARLAHLRLVNRVRDILYETIRAEQLSDEQANKSLRQRAARRQSLSWNATAAAQAEIIEFLEELIDLTKLLVGANEFRSGILKRENYQAYIGGGAHTQGADEDPIELQDSFPSTGVIAGPARTMRKRRWGGTVHGSSADGVPASLRKVQTRKQDGMSMQKRANKDKEG